MGYRSCGKIWLPPKTFKHLSNEMITDLENWEEDGDDVYSFYDWKWYTGYNDVDMWRRFVFDYCSEHNLQVDLIVVGEDGAVVDEATQGKFYARTEIEVY